jgi:predicted MPP superfamily phosphohydrolase
VTEAIPPSLLAPGVAAGVAAVSMLALRFRGRFYAIYAVIVLSLVGLITLGMIGALPALWPAFAYLLAVTFAHFAAQIWARPRPLLFRLFISWPALFFSGGTLLAFPWALAHAFGGSLPLPLLPYAIALFGLVESVWLRPSVVDLVLDEGDAGATVRRHPRGEARVERPLRLVQITDPHLGPFMSPRRLARICERAVAADPDLILLTGDFLTMESNAHPALLTEALAPLAAMRGRVFACRGNHDLEAPRTVASALAHAGVVLLVDEEAVVDTPSGPVQVVGLDHAFRDRKERMARALQASPRRPGHLRLVLLHDPGAFRLLPEGEADLVLSGHTHGGHVGLLRLGLPFTAVSVFARMPDHGFFARGRDRLYVHRGTGHYGFPVRVGVPPEESVLRVHRVG